MSSGIGCGSPLRQITSLICRFWAPNVPNNYDCVHTEPSKRNLWNDNKCTRHFRWICKQAHGPAGL
uniref:C-type lectin domain-containing protein n=1 Tax=Chrysemys picta bellii TaxID=8478 RepID=A0A8C3H769_CHRPI